MYRGKVHSFLGSSNEENGNKGRRSKEGGQVEGAGRSSNEEKLVKAVKKERKEFLAALLTQRLGHFTLLSLSITFFENHPPIPSAHLSHHLSDHDFKS